MPYWCAARLQPHREALALNYLGVAGYEVYYPRLRDRRIRHGDLRRAPYHGWPPTKPSHLSCRSCEELN